MGKSITPQQKKIILAAFELFKEKGYEDTTTREIAAKADIRRGLLYYYFHKKEDIVFLWYRNFLDTIYNRIQKDSRESQNHLLSLMTFLFVYYQTLESDEFALSLINCILTHHDLTQRKVRYTTDFYSQILPEYSKDRILVINAMLIGGESQLLPMIIDHEISMSISTFTEKFIRTSLSYFKVEKEQAEQLYQKAKKDAQAYHHKDYQNFIHLNTD